MRKRLIAIFEQSKNSSISLSELEQVASTYDTYEDFAVTILALLEEGYITAVKNHGVNWKGLPNSLRIQKGKVKQLLIGDIQELQFKVHSLIELQSYFSLSKDKWLNDRPWIEKINQYLKNNGLPTIYTNSSERSYDLVKDEKWIDEKGGKAILEKINLFDKLKIMKSPDPLMFAINPNELTSSSKIHKHLIVENKVTYSSLINELSAMTYTTLIYGSGWKIASSLSQLNLQLGLTSKEYQHEIYYFGDLDYEGISIFYYLSEKYHVKLASSFYEALIQKPFYKGKENQTRNDVAVHSFLQYFSKEDQKKIENLLEQNGYYPQEALTKEELQNIWRKI